MGASCGTHSRNDRRKKKQPLVGTTPIKPSTKQSRSFKVVDIERSQLGVVKTPHPQEVTFDVNGDPNGVLQKTTTATRSTENSVGGCTVGSGATGVVHRHCMVQGGISQFPTDTSVKVDLLWEDVKVDAGPIEFDLVTGRLLRPNFAFGISGPHPFLNVPSKCRRQPSKSPRYEEFAAEGPNIPEVLQKIARSAPKLRLETFTNTYLSIEDVAWTYYGKSIEHVGLGATGMVYFCSECKMNFGTFLGWLDLTGYNLSEIQGGIEQKTDQLCLRIGLHRSRKLIRVVLYEPAHSQNSNLCVDLILRLREETAEQLL